MVIEKLEVINKNLSELGYENIYDFVIDQMIGIAKEKLKKSEDTVRGFEQKYGMNFDTYRKNFHSFNFELIEKEDDQVDWEVELSFLETHKQALFELESLRPKQED